MTTDDTSRSPSLGGEQREGPTGREPGLPRLHQQRYEEMTIDELIALMNIEQRELLICDCLDRVMPYIDYPDKDVSRVARHVMKCCEGCSGAYIHAAMVYSRGVFGYLEVAKKTGKWREGSINEYIIGREKMARFQKARAIEYLTGRAE